MSSTVDGRADAATRAVATTADVALGRQLVLDEIFDLSLYRSQREVATGRLRAILDELIQVETRHVAFWQRFFHLEGLTALDARRRWKLRALVAVCRVFGAGAIHVVLEAIEVHGVRKYLRVWDRYKDGPLGAAVREILQDEFQHEDMVVSGAAERHINPDKVRNVFLGLNDGLVEILGAVSGFFAAFRSTPAVLAAGFTVAVAGAMSMAAGAYIGAGSEAEVRATETGRRRLSPDPAGEKPDWVQEPDQDGVGSLPRWLPLRSPYRQGAARSACRRFDLPERLRVRRVQRADPQRPT